MILLCISALYGPIKEGEIAKLRVVRYLRAVQFYIIVKFHQRGQMLEGYFAIPGFALQISRYLFAFSHRASTFFHTFVYCSLHSIRRIPSQGHPIIGITLMYLIHPFVLFVNVSLVAFVLCLGDLFTLLVLSF